MQILVTGAAGAIGKNLTEYLCEVGHQVIPVDLVQYEGAI